MFDLSGHTHSTPPQIARLKAETELPNLDP